MPPLLMTMSTPTDHMDDAPERITVLHCVGCENVTLLNYAPSGNPGLQCSCCGNLHREDARLLTYTQDNE